MALYIGLMSGTSLDGVDSVLVDINAHEITQHSAATTSMPNELRGEILALIDSADNVSLNRLGRLDAWLGEWFADAVLDLLSKASCRAYSVHAIGSHGQTLWHHPIAPLPFTIQLGDPNRIVERTGITTVADFRRRDMAAGGQGAPLVPAFHHACLKSQHETRIILNLGGMANITLLPISANATPIGFDTGPGNVLMDLQARRHLDQPFDDAGHWAATGHIDNTLLRDMLADPYFGKPHPKSTGREHFNETWLLTFCHRHPDIPAENIQATLAELTARSVCDAIQSLRGSGVDRILVCGGGVHNKHLMSRIRALAAPLSVDSTDQYGINPDYVEASAFAWLAYCTLNGLPGNLPGVTGARHPAILGAIHPGNRRADREAWASLK